MMRIENDCCDCQIPCANCGLKHVKHFYCDICGEEDVLYEYEGQQLCKDCLARQHKIVEENEKKEKDKM